MIDLHKAYQVLGLDPGTSLESVKRRYKRLVIVWHPDRMPNDAGRREAEEELKKINGAFDLLKNHFDKHHTPGSTCDCQRQTTTSNGSQQGARGSDKQSSNAGRDDGKRRREQEAKRREKERRRAEDEARQSEAARKAEEQQRAGDAAKQATEQAVQQKQARKDEKLRWQAALAAGMAFILILGFGWLGITTRAAIAELQRQWNGLLQSTNRSVSQSPGTVNAGDAQASPHLGTDPYGL